MEIAALLFMLIAGGGLAIFVLFVMNLLKREEEHANRGAAVATPQRDNVAASLLFHVVHSGGGTAEEAMREVRRGTGIGAHITRGIDVGNWAESYARAAAVQERQELLEMAVRLVAARSPVPVRQYAALLDLSFGLGFQTDALAKLRELYGFEYMDHAKDARPRSADRAGGGAPLFAREPRRKDELLRILGIEGAPSRQEVSAAYRKLVSRHHPDRYHGASAEVQTDAAARFIEITRAYEELMRTL